MSDDPETAPALDTDANLGRVKRVEGYKVLPPCVLYGKIGQGGMGAVYRGRHLNLDIDVAVKCLKPDLIGDDEQFVVRFRREARSAARINHQNVVRVFDVSEEAGLHYIVMELVQGETARQRVQRKQRLAVGEALEILYQAARGLGEAHSKGFIHRDIKPDNLMIAQSGQVKVADLGLAKPSGSGQMSMLSGTNVVMGTPQYMPPEQWENTATVTPAADVWALGATLYYLLVGGEAIAKDSLPRIMQRIVLQPFPDVREQRADVPDDVAALIARATAKAPEERFADAGAMADAIERLETRRESLRDMHTSTDAEHNTLLSPPPAKTLAKIKFWLDEQAQGGGGRAAAGRGDDVVVGDGGTMVMPAPGARPPAARTAAARRGAGVWVAVLVLAAVAAALGVWQPWSSADPFAKSERLQRNGQFVEAIRAAEEAYAADPGLTGRAQRLAGLHAEFAAALLDQGRLLAALQRLDESAGFAATPRAEALREKALAIAAARLDGDLQLTSPNGSPDSVVADVTAVPVAGRLASMLVKELRVGGQVVPIAADGGFEATVDLQGATRLDVVAVLQAGGEVFVRSVAVRLAAQADDATGGDGTGSAGPVVVTPAGEQPAVTNTPAPVVERRDAPPARAALAEVVQVAPARVELVGGNDGELTIDAPADAEVFVDGARVARDDRGRYVHAVRSDEARPASVRVVVRREGDADVERTVEVARVERALRFARAPALVDAQRVAGPGGAARYATKAAGVQVRGRVSEAVEQLLVNDRVVPDVSWQGQEFTVTVPLVEGANSVRLEARRPFCSSATAALTVYRLVAPQPRLAGDAAAQQQVAAARYEVAVTVDEWARSATAAGVGLRRVGDEFRGAVPLEVGENVIPVVVTDAVGQQGALELRIERLPASAKPELRALTLQRGDEGEAVREKAQVFVRGDARLVVDSSDPDADVFVNDERVGAAGDGSIDLQPLLVDEAFRAVKVVLQNGAGKSAVRTFFAMRDATPPVASCTAPGAPVAKGQPFELSGTWQDGGGLQSDGTRIGELVATLSARGINKEGTWQLTHPGLEQTTVLELVVTDRAGNRITLPIEVVVQ